MKVYKCILERLKEFKFLIFGINNFCLILYIFRVEGIFFEIFGIDVEFYYNFVVFVFLKKMVY